jgi:prepilin-type N-terminal cleavage/methylation domain-containing protein
MPIFKKPSQCFAEAGKYDDHGWGEVMTSWDDSIRERRAGFTLIELLVVIGILGLLIGLAMPAVQQAREASRRTQCRNNLKNQATALHMFHDAKSHFPAGNYGIDDLHHSWSLHILPYLEQNNLYERFQLKKAWNEGENLAAAKTVLPVFRCPTSAWKHEGDTDYCGIMGSGATGAGWDTALSNGILVVKRDTTQPFIKLSDVTDGTSQTILVAESADRLPEEHGNWADGLGTIYCDGEINHERGNLYCHHVGGAFTAFADGSVSFLASTADDYVIGALCTRNEQEIVERTF